MGGFAGALLGDGQGPDDRQQPAQQPDQGGRSRRRDIFRRIAQGLAAAGLQYSDPTGRSAAPLLERIDEDRQRRRQEDETRKALAGLPEDAQALLAPLPQPMQQAGIQAYIRRQIDPRVLQGADGINRFETGAPVFADVAERRLADQDRERQNALADRQRRIEREDFELSAAREGQEFRREDRAIAAEDRAFDRELRIRQHELDMAKYQNDVAKKGAGKATEDLNARRSLRGQFQQFTSGFSDAVAQSSLISDNLSLATGFGDSSAIVLYLQMLDGSVVRESEFARTQNLGSIKERWQAQLKSIESGQLLTPQLRKELQDSVTLALGSARQRGAEMQRIFTAEAEKAGYDPFLVVGDDPFGLNTERDARSTAGPGSTSAEAGADALPRYRRENGSLVRVK